MQIGVGHGIADHILKEDLYNSTSVLIEQSRDTLDLTTKELLKWNDCSWYSKEEIEIKGWKLKI